MPYEWLTAREAADYARCNVATIYELVKVGKLKAARITGKKDLRFRKNWIDDWLIKSSKLPRDPMAANQ